ncbi:MAG: glycosyltransferase family A protein [Candidatus Diapherotrites archaeon]
MMMKSPPVSIVIPTLNNPETLRKVLEGMLKLEYPANYEIIVVNDGSNDYTKEMLKQFDKNDKISVINLPRSGVCKARNAGIAKAKYDFVINMDHDCIPEKDWLKVMMTGFDSEKVGIVTGYGGYGGTSTAFRKDVLEKVGGYDEDYFYYREDTDIAFKIIEQGFEIKKVPKRYVHDHKMTKPKGTLQMIKHVWARLKNHKNDVLLYKKHPNKLTEDFLDIKFGFLINPMKDFGAATGLWHNNSKFNLSSPRGITYLENKTPIHALITIFVGICYVFAVKTMRLYASIKFLKLLI